MSDEIKSGLNYFDRQYSTLDGLPDVVKTRPTTIRVVPHNLGIGTHTYIVSAARQREKGDTIFLEVASESGITRIVIPPAVADTIARHREQLNGKSRSRAGKRIAEDLKRQGIKPGFMRKKI